MALATWEVFAGLTLVITEGYPIRALGEKFSVLGKGEIAPVRSSSRLRWC